MFTVNIHLYLHRYLLLKVMIVLCFCKVLILPKSMTADFMSTANILM